MDKLSGLSWAKAIVIALGLVPVGTIIGIAIGVLIATAAPNYYAIMFDADPAFSLQIGIGAGASQGTILGGVVSSSFLIATGLSQRKKSNMPSLESSYSIYPREE